MRARPNFAPAPWAVHVSVPGECLLGQGHYVGGADGTGVAYAQRSPEDARLIAAAPDLLAALERTLSWLTSYPGGGAMGVYDQARAALAKALGEPAGPQPDDEAPHTFDRERP